MNEFEGLSKDQINNILEERELKTGTQILEMVFYFFVILRFADWRYSGCRDETTGECAVYLQTESSYDWRGFGNYFFTVWKDFEVFILFLFNFCSCEIIRDYKTNDSLQYGFIEFENVCPNLYLWLLFYFSLFWFLNMELNFIRNIFILL